jgi:hypothetical protein
MDKLGTNIFIFYFILTSLFFIFVLKTSFIFNLFRISGISTWNILINITLVALFALFALDALIALVTLVTLDAFVPFVTLRLFLQVI